MKTKTIVLSGKQENELEQILRELIYSLKKTYSDEDLVKLSYLIFSQSLKQTFNSKKDTATALLKSIGKHSGNAYSFSKNKYFSYKKNGFENEFFKDVSSTQSFIGKVPEKIERFGGNMSQKLKTLNNDFLKKSKDEKIELISVSILGVLIFFASAGGEDLEGGIPDSDLNLGIGYHRHLMSHSIIIGFIVEFMMRSGIEIINSSYKNLPSGYSGDTDPPFRSY